MNELFGADVRRLLNFRFLKAALKVCLLARVGDDRPRFRFHSLSPEGRRANWHLRQIQLQPRIHLHLPMVIKSMTGSQFRI
jgi:hypothetical protein